MSKIPQEAIDAGARAIWERIEDEISFEKACKEKHPQIEWTIKDAEVCIEAADAAREQGAEVEPVKFPVGTQVEKSSGYQWPGEVRSVFTTKNGHLRYVVECTVVEVAGALHIYSETQLRSALTTPPAPQPTDREKVLEELRKALTDAEYRPGDHPIVPVRVAAFMEKARAALAGDEAPSQTDRAEGGE